MLKNNKSCIIGYTVLGALFGLAFPVIAIVLDILVFNDLPLSFSSFILVYEENPLHYIISSAPLVLGMTGYIIGQKQSTILNIANTKYSNLKRHEDKILDSIAEGVYGIDKNLITTFFNSAAEELLGWSAEEIIGKKQHALTHHTRADGSEYPLDECQMYMAVQDGETRHIKGELFWRKDGSSFPVEYTASPVKDDRGNITGAVVVFRDVSKESALQDALHHAKEAAESSARTKSEFLANMSHEIRTPMNGVIGMGNLLLGTDLKPKQRSYTETLISSADALLEIINDILDLSKIESGKLELEEIPFDLLSLLEDVAEFMAIQTREKGLELLLRCPPNTPRYVMGDPGRIRQIFFNLIGNAIKFTEQGYILITIEQQEFSEGELIFRCNIQDTGIGIPKDKLEYIFTKFNQAEGSTARKFGGTGLGLAICRELSELMGGEVGIESTLGEGSTFWFTMKLAENKDQTCLLSNTGINLKGTRILIVDNNNIACGIMREQLLALGIEAEEADSSQLALSLLQNPDKFFDIMIVSHSMPEMDGEALGETVLSNTSYTTPIMIICTSQPQKGDGKRLAQKGFCGYLTKPVHLSILPDMIGVLLTAQNEKITIPMVTRHTLREKNTVTKTEPISFSGIQILLAEDNAVNQMVASTMLENFGCIVTPAGNGKEAVEQVMQRGFDLILMDCQMPEMDGFEATAAIRNYQQEQQQKPTAIIAFTAAAMREEIDKCFSNGMDDYLSKPVKPEELEDLLAKWLGNNDKIEGN